MKVLLVVSFACWMIPGIARAETVSVADLETTPEAYDDRTVTLRGELVGDYGVRRDGIWVQLNDDPYVDAPLAETGGLAGGNVGLGVWLPLEHLDLLGRHAPGRYGRRGPVVEVTGTFRYHDPALGGETYLRAAGLTLIQPGRPLEAPPRRWPAAGGAALLALAAALAVRVSRTIEPPCWRGDR